VSQGTLTGSATGVDSADDLYRSITEDVVGDTSGLEMIWEFSVTPAELVTVYVEAHHTANSEGDDFVFAYSTDGVTYYEMLTVTKTADDDQTQFFVLPGGTSGTVYIMAQDADQTSGNTQLDTLNVDQLYIQSEESTAAPANPALLFPANGATDVSVDADLLWEQAEGAATYSIRFGTVAESTQSIPFVGNQEETFFDPGTLQYDTTYNWRIIGVNNSGNSFSEIWTFTTESDPATANDMHVSNIFCDQINENKGQKRASVAVTIVDSQGAAVANATVSVDITGSFNESISAVTNASGVAELTSSTTVKGNISFTATVTDVTHATLPYDPTDNVISSQTY